MGDFQRITPAPEGDPKPLEKELDEQKQPQQQQQQQQDPPAGDPPRPAWLPEKFKTAEDLAKAYSELEVKFTQTQQQPPKKTETPPTPGQQTPPQQGTADWAVPVREFQEKGQVTKETYEAFEKIGVPKAVVDTYVSGIMKTVEAEQAELYSRAGNKQVYEAMVQWAQANLTSAEIEAYDKTISEGSLDAAKIAIDGLKARYEAVVGKIPSQQIDGSRGTATVGYQSRAEMIRDMQDPRYATDPAFRKQVEQKVMSSTVF